MDDIIVLKFGPSPSKYFRKAVSLAKKFSNSQLAENQKTCYIQMTADEFAKKKKLFWELQKLIRNWDSAEFYIDKQKIVPFKSLASRLNLVMRCASGFTNIQEHCNFNPHMEAWGCKHLLKIKLHLLQELDSYNDEEYWYKFGKFSDATTWTVDKQRIASIVKREIDEKHLLLCPHFSMPKVQGKLDAIPEEIDLYGNPSWEIETVEDFANDEIVEKPIGISHKRENLSEEDEGGGILSRRSFLSGKFMKNKEKPSENTKRPKRFIPKVKFEEIGGIDDILTKIREVIELPILQPELFSHLGIQPHKGIILHGPPGTGKTMIAKAIANEIKAHFILVNGPEVVSKWQGESEKNLRDIFDEANNYAPSVIFFDEIDALASKRSASEMRRSASQIVNQMLTLFDGVNENKGVVVLASTNRIELLDPAILRSGRFDYKIEVPNPNLEGCLTILKIKTQKMPIDKAFDLEQFAPKLLGLSGAEIAFVVNESAYNALRRSINIIDSIKKQSKQSFEDIIIENQDFEKALQTLKSEKKEDKRLGF